MSLTSSWIIPAGRGVRHTNNWAEGERPKNPREGMAMLYPNGLPLMSLLAMMKSEKPKDAEFSEYTKSFPLQNDDIVGVYTNSGLGTPLPNAAYDAGKVVYIKVSADFANECRPGHVVECRRGINHLSNVAFDVIESVADGDSPYIVARSLESMTNGNTRNVTLCDRIWILAPAQEEGAIMPVEVNYNPVKMWNYTQIFETSFSSTGTQEEVEMVTFKGSTILKEKKEKAEIHAQAIERAFFFGRRLEKTVNGKPKRYTMGVIPMIELYAPEHVFDFANETNPKYKGKTWLEAGMPWLDEKFGIISKWGNPVRTGFCGNGARIGLTSLGRAWGTINLQPQQKDFGIWFEEWYHNGMSINLKTHGMFSMEPSNDNMLTLFDMANLSERPLRNTRSRMRPEGEIDGKKGSWLTETGLFFRFPPTFAIFRNIGVDNVQ